VILGRVFSAGPSAAAKRATGESWPREAVVDALRARFPALDDLGEEGAFALYRVTDGEVRFVVALHLVEGARRKVLDVGFIARFSGYDLSEAALERANRLLHISVLAEDLGDIYLLSAVEAAGPFNAETFSLLLEAWRRDLLVALHALSGGTLASAFPLARSALALQNATNAASEGRSASDLFRAFAAAAGRDAAVCPDCGGRGRAGLFARLCAACGGAGFSARR